MTNGEIPSVALTRRFLIQCDRHGSQSLAVKLVAQARSIGVPGLPEGDDWTEWDAGQMRAAVEHLERVHRRAGAVQYRLNFTGDAPSDGRSGEPAGEDGL